MPIKGVSEVVRLPRRGKIRLGIKKEGEGGQDYPTPTDYFVCPEEVKKVFGDRPKELRIMFPTEDQTQWASQFLRCYSDKRGLICRGDGETAIARVDVKTGEIAARNSSVTELKEIICRPGSCPLHQDKRCRQVMNLQFLLPDCPGLGVYQLDTGSYYSIRNINSMLALIRATCRRVSMIPLTLRLVEKEVQPEGFPAKVKIHVLELTSDYNIAQMQKMALVPRGEILLLPPPDIEAPDDLFPDEVLKSDSPVEEPPKQDQELVNLWDKAKRKIWRFDIRDSQIAGWFGRNHGIDAGLKDFDYPLPPVKFTKEALKHFCKAVERYASDN